VTTPLAARARLLGERLDHRGLGLAFHGAIGPLDVPGEPGAVAFAFRWGALVTIGASAAGATALASSLAARLAEPLAPPVEETAEIAEGGADAPDADGVLRLRDLSTPRLALVAEMLAKSAALSHQEGMLARSLDRIEPIVGRLATQGRLAVTSGALLRSMGESLAARTRAAGRVDTSAKPDLLWDHPELEPLCKRLADEWELPERSEALEQKLVIIRETSEAMLSLIEARRSRGLELAVVLLIAIELGTALWGLFTGR
jgi:required for meiotic nuclear division protein 1